MQLSRPDADVFVPDATPMPEALRRATHVCVGAHQDDQEFMAFHGIAECFGRKDKHYAGIVVTNGGGSSRTGLYADYTDEQNQALVDLIRTIASRKQTTPARVALAWLLAQKPWIVPIPGTTKRHRLEENVGAAEVELTPDDLGEIESAASKITIQGARYPEHIERLSER